VVVLSLLVMSGCAGTTARDTTTGNVVAVDRVAAPAAARWYTGQLVVEPAGPGSACLLLSTPSGKYVLRPTARRLAAVVWQTDGQFDATQSGIARGDRMVAPYADERTSVRGGVVAKSDSVCGSHPTLGFAQVKRGRARPVSSATPSDAPSSATNSVEGAAGARDGHALSPLDEVWKSGTLGVAVGNQGEGHCVLLVTAEGAYALGSSTNDYDTLVTETEDGVDPRRTGIHIHGRNTLGMARTLGQHVELRGWVEPGTDFSCSKYPGFGITALR
jgi:hypothetical protein